MVSGRCLERVLKVIGTFPDQVGMQSILIFCKKHLASWVTKLTLDFTQIKIKTCTWNSSVALLSPTCFEIFSKPSLRSTPLGY